MNGTEEMEDMIEIKNIKQESEIKEEIDLSCNEELDYLSIEKFVSTDVETCNSKSLNHVNISYTRNENDCEVSNIELQEETMIIQDGSCPENAIDNILFQCEGCNKPAEGLVDHTYTKPCNRLKEVVENEEKKEVVDQLYTCKFCPFIVVSPQKYLLHLQTHESEDCTCRSCHENLKVSDLLNVHMLIKFRSCEICRKVFTRERGYKQHLKVHHTVPKKNPVTKKNVDSNVQTMRFEEITIKEENHEIDPEVGISANNKEILPNKEDIENVIEEPETSVKNGKIRKEVEPIANCTKELESCQTSFSEYVKGWKNTDRENIIPKSMILKGGDVWANKESSPKNERNEDPAPTPSTGEILEIQEIRVVETSKGLPQPKKSTFFSSFEEAIPRNKIEEVIFLFECTGCARNFVSKKAILEHVTKKHTDEFRLWETLYVKKKLADKKPTQTINVNSEKGKYTCRFCPVKFNTASMYSNHLKIHHVCSNCDKIFSSQKLLENHKCEFPKSLVCHICNKSFLFRNNYIAHLNTHENDCEICKEQFTSESLLTIHRKYVHPEGICYVCHRWFSSESLLKEHRTKVHDISVMSFFCWICEKNIRSERKFRAHMEVHGEKRPFSCPHCGKFYVRYLAMTTHSERCDLFDERKVFECDICKKAFYNKKKFVPHMKQHFESHEMPPIDKLTGKDRKILRLIKDMKNSKGAKNSRSLPNKMISPSSLKSDNNLKCLSFGPKIVWRESSLQTTTLPSKIEQKRERERLRKHQRQKEIEQLRKLNLINPAPSTYSRKRKVLDSDIKSTAEAYLTNKNLIVNNLEINNEITFKNRNEFNKKKLDKKLSPVKLQGRSLLRPRILGHVSGTKFERSKGIDVKNIKESEKSIFSVARKRQVRHRFEDEPVEKLLILRPITKVIRRGKIEKSGKKNIRINIVSSKSNFQTKESDSTFNLQPVRTEIDPLNLEDSPIDVASEMVNLPADGESDPLALENLPMDSEIKMIISSAGNDESDPLALENSPMDSTAEAASEPITIDSETSDSETKNSEKCSKIKSNEYVSKLRQVRRKTYNSIHTIEHNKTELQKKKDYSKNTREVKKCESNADFFFCTICKRRISSVLKVEHVKIHDEGLKMFECTVCEKKFITGMGKIRHEKTHTKK